MSPSHSKKIEWNDPLEKLFSKNANATLDSLKGAHLLKISDLLSIFPLRIEEIPDVAPFGYAREGNLFKGEGKILNIQAKANFWAKGKRGALLQNMSVHIKDLHSEEILLLRFFNAYGSVVSKMKSLDLISFAGEVTQGRGEKYIANPSFEGILAPKNLSEEKSEKEIRVHYPTINSVPGKNISKVFNKIPEELWDAIGENLPSNILKEHCLLSRSETYKILHGKLLPNEELQKRAKSRLAYEEFFFEQLKIALRREHFKKPRADIFSVSKEDFIDLKKKFPFELTLDQENALREIRKDLESASPMMRLLQGDVGSGKTAVAALASLIVLKSSSQVAFMCPTETLALQHFESLKNLIPPQNLALLLGSTPPSEKKEILKKLEAGEILFVVGTHALIQEGVNFKKLSLAIIDEQHKFGVEQRLKLTEKSQGIHCLIMTATPIPRSLRLTQYGDLDISTIRSMPLGRKGIKTRIVQKENFETFLSFIKTRLTMKEQGYIVVPAISESETMNLRHLEEVEEKFKHYFPEFQQLSLHGKMKPQEKAQVFKDFASGKAQLLIATSVIEVGINVPQATFIAIMNPERFGLSSLHQLRGRVGRAELPGFCFLICDKKHSPETLERLAVIENNTDGFIIAEEDLKIRGEGNLFGTEQSGSELRRFSNAYLFPEELDWAIKDASLNLHSDDPQMKALLEKFSLDEKVFITV